MIISAGENIYPSEVEAALGSHPKVRDVAIVGARDEKWGERVHAFVILHDGEAATADELADWCRDRIATFKRPRAVTFIARPRCPVPRPVRSSIASCGSGSCSRKGDRRIRRSPYVTPCADNRRTERHALKGVG